MVAPFTGFSYGPGLAALGKGFDAIGKGFDEEHKRQTLAELGAGLTNPNADFRVLAGKALESGHSDLASNFLKMAESRAASTAFNNELGGILGGGGIESLGTSAGGLVPQASAAPSPRLPTMASGAGPAGTYMDTLIGKESGGNVVARNPMSSATGLGQFTTGTWESLARSRPDLGLTSDGRTDPDQSRRAIAALAQDNGRQLAEAGHEQTDGNLYLAHFLGGAGATRFLSGMQTDPNAPAAAYADPKAVAANRTLFFNRDGTPKTATAFYAERTSKFGGAPQPASYDVAMAGGSPRQAPAAPMQVADASGQMPPSDQSQSGPRMLLSRDNPLPLPADLAQADLPRTDSTEVQAFIVPGSGQVIPAKAPLPEPATPRDAAFMKMNSGAGIGRLAKLVAMPGISEGQREIAKMMFANALQDSKAPESVREYIWARANGMTKARTPGEYAKEKTTTESPGQKIESEVTARTGQAQVLGLDPNTPEGRRYALTGQIAARDAPMSASDRKAILEADEAVVSAENSITALSDAKKLSKEAYYGPSAGWRGKVSSLWGDTAGVATSELDNLVSTNAVGQLKALFGGNPTEGERKILLDLQGSSSQPPEVREKIFDRGITLARKRIDIAKERAAELRGGTYYKPGSGPQGAGAQAPAGAVQALRSDPNLAAQFDEKYGPGAAARALGR